MDVAVYSHEAEEDLIESSRRLALAEINKLLEDVAAADAYEPRQLCLERHRDRVSKIQRLFLQKRAQATCSEGPRA